MSAVVANTRDKILWASYSYPINTYGPTRIRIHSSLSYMIYPSVFGLSPHPGCYHGCEAAVWLKASQMYLRSPLWRLQSDSRHHKCVYVVFCEGASQKFMSPRRWKNTYITQPYLQDIMLQHVGVGVFITTHKTFIVFLCRKSCLSSCLVYSILIVHSF